MASGVGVLGLGCWLPMDRRGNDYWSAATVERWRQKHERLEGYLRAMELTSDGERAARDAWLEGLADPFGGTVERRVMIERAPMSRYETLAAREALERSGKSPDEIDLLLVHSVVPDYINTLNAGVVHHGLGLGKRCLSLSTESMCNTFSAQLSLAAAYIAAGRAKNALLVQSSALPVLVPDDEPPSAWFSDGATAVVVGAVAEGSGLLAEVHHTDGSEQDCLVFGVPERRWYDDGAVVLYANNPDAVHRMLLHIPDLGRSAVHEALARAELELDDVGFYSCHQPTVWMRSVTQRLMGLERARFEDTFPWVGSLSSCNVPLQWYVAEREGRLCSGDVVVGFTGGAGETWSAFVLRWGG